MYKKNLLKKTTIALSVAGIFITRNAFSRSIDVTGQTKGARPELQAVQVQGELKVGMTLKIPDSYVKDDFTGDFLTDTDGDVPLTFAELNALVKNPDGNVFEFIEGENHIEWFLVPDSYEDVDGSKDNWLTQAEFDGLPQAVKESLIFLNGQTVTIDGKSVATPNYQGKQEITLPAIALGKRIGFKITARTKTGFPIDAEPVYVMNAFLTDGEGPTDPVTPPGPPGTVDPWVTKLVLQTRARGTTEWKTINTELPDDYPLAANVTQADYSVVNTEFRAMLFDEKGRSIDHLYKDAEAFAWRLVATEGMVYNGKPLTSADLAKPEFAEALAKKYNNYTSDASGDFFLFSVQDINANSIISPFIEQGLKLTLDIDDTKADIGVDNPDSTSPLSAIEP